MFLETTNKPHIVKIDLSGICNDCWRWYSEIYFCLQIFHDKVVRFKIIYYSALAGSHIMLLPVVEQFGRERIILNVFCSMLSLLASIPSSIPCSCLFRGFVFDFPGNPLTPQGHQECQAIRYEYLLGWEVSLALEAQLMLRVSSCFWLVSSFLTQGILSSLLSFSTD